MTILRTALRLCAVAALTGVDGARPTIAEGRFWDSRVGDFAPDSYIDDAKPTGIVLTDKDDGDALSNQDGGPPFRRMVDLVVELGMIQAEAAEDENGDPVVDDQGRQVYAVGTPNTDARHEASLDILETQVLRHLSYSDDPFCFQFRQMCRIVKMDSHRQVMDDAGVKIAARVLTLQCDCGDDQVQVFKTGTQPTGLDVLPEPLLSVAKLLPASSEGAQICAKVAAALGALTATPLETFDVTLTQPPGTPAISASIDMTGEP